MKQVTSRPQITAYQDPSVFVRDMISYRRETEPQFSVLKSAKSLRRVSPSLVSLVSQGRRRVTSDRTDEFAKLLGLNPTEKIYFRDWIRRENREIEPVPPSGSKAPASTRREVSTHILVDWLNLYVKDCFQIADVSRDPRLVYRLLGHIASQKRIDRAIAFLLREGHLRKTLEGHLVVEANLTVTDPQVPSAKIRQLHRAALGIARDAIEACPPSERFANTLIVPLGPDDYAELVEIAREFATRLQEFASRPAQPSSDRLYQIVLNLSPTGGKPE